MKINYYILSVLLVFSSLGTRHGFAEDKNTDQPVSKSVKLTHKQVFGVVNQLVNAGRFNEAKQLLAQLEEAGAEKNQIQFLRGLMAGAKGNWQEASLYYRTILANDPGLVRVRLELGRALFNNKDATNAKRQFDLVLADNEQLPEPVKEKVRNYLTAIHTLRPWSVSLAFNIVPDTNINTATSSDRVSLFGLPFDLSDEAKKSTGVGFTGDIGASYRFDIGKGKAIDASASIRHTEYLHTSAFDQTFAGVRVGPRFFNKNNDLRLAVTGGYARFGGQGFYKSFGGQVSYVRKISDRLSLTSQFNVRDMKYFRNEARNGLVFGFVEQVNYTLTPTSAARLYAGFTRENANHKSLKSKSYTVGGGYVREFGKGITANLRANYAHRPFDGFSFLYGKVRKDNTYGAGVGLTKRDMTLLGFAPVISYDYYRSRSNVEFFTFDRHRVNFSFTRVF